MLERDSPADELSVGIMNTSAPWYMIQCATDCSRYCSTLFLNPSSTGGVCIRRAESPMRRARLPMLLPACPVFALLSYDLRKRLLRRVAPACPLGVVAGREGVANRLARILRAQFDRVLLDVRKRIHDVVADLDALVGTRIDQLPAQAKAAGLEAVERVAEPDRPVLGFRADIPIEILHRFDHACPGHLVEKTAEIGPRQHIGRPPAERKGEYRIKERRIELGIETLHDRRGRAQRDELRDVTAEQ